MSDVIENSEFNTIPRHVAVIMDGNGRWAKKRFFPRTSGHKAGIKSVRQSIEYAVEIKLEYLTLFAFGRENWKRPQKEVNTLMKLFSQVLVDELPMLIDNHVKLQIVGDRTRLCDQVLTDIEITEQKTAHNTGLHLNIAIDYSGQWEILEAVKTFTRCVLAGQCTVDDLSQSAFENSLQPATALPVDLLIRTSGEKRISNFMIWQLAYAELYFCDTLWPDFKKADFQAAIEFFQQRQRRFGKTDDQLKR